VKKVDTQWLLLFGIPGTVFLTYGILIRLGILKYWFIARYIPGAFPAVLPYAIIPGGIGFTIIALAAFFPGPEKTRNVFGIGTAVVFLGLVVATFRPGFLKPKWLRWLESRYTHLTINLLVEEARKLGWWEWQKRVWTQEGLEQWVEETLRKRGVNP
jgi:hypothetical protein